MSYIFKNKLNSCFYCLLTNDKHKSILYDLSVKYINLAQTNL